MYITVKNNSEVESSFRKRNLKIANYLMHVNHKLS